jgi:hypothetical protein
MNKVLVIVVIFIALLVLPSCEEEFVPKASLEPTEIVVEGYIEAGEGTQPAYVILTKSLPFFSEIGTEQLDAIFIHDADVRVFDGVQEVQLPEFCLSELPQPLREIIASQFGLNANVIEVDFCVYLDLADQITREFGRSYQLTVKTGMSTLYASTTIPGHVPIDSLYFDAPPGEPNDTLAQLLVTISDPAETADFYRYFTNVGNRKFQSPVSSVTEDVFFNGKTFEFQLLKAENINEDLDPETFGLYTIGDSIGIKWCNIDKDHFEFWNTLEFSNANQGPFAGYTRIDSNIEGGLGIWGGYSVSFYRLLVDY